MALHSPLSSFPAGRYTHTNPLRREFGLQLLSEPLPDPLRASLITAWRHPARYDSNAAIQSAGAQGAAENVATVVPASQFPQAPAAAGVHRQRPAEASLPTMPPRILSWLALMELGVSRRVVEAPLASISRDTRNRLLISQGMYLRSLYAALALQIGEAAALAEFQRLLLTAR